MEASVAADNVALVDCLTLAIGKELLVLGACIEHSLQLQLTQLALLDRLFRKAVPQRIAAFWEGDGTACSIKTSFTIHQHASTACAGFDHHTDMGRWHKGNQNTSSLQLLR